MDETENRKSIKFTIARSCQYPILITSEISTYLKFEQFEYDDIITPKSGFIFILNETRMAELCKCRKLKFCYDQDYNDIGVVIATKGRH